MTEALAGYFSAQADVTHDLLELNDIMEQIEDAIERGVRSQDQMDEVAAYVDNYVARSEQAAQKLDDLIALEDQIVPYGDRGMFTDLVGGVCKGIYNTGKNMVVSSGQMVRTGWRVVSGSHGLREALSAPDSGIPLVSGWAQDLERTTNRRNDHIAERIAAGDSQEGWIPYDQIPGSTPAEKAQNYRNLPESDPLKREAHRNFLLWSPDGWNDCLTTLKDASKTGVKAYGEAVSGSGLLVEVTEQLVTPGQDPSSKAPVTPVIKDKETSTPIGEPKTMIISKRGQPESEPKIVVLEGVDPEFEIEFPEGSYDIITIAEDYIRSAELGLQVVTDQATGFLAELLEFANNSLVMEAITVSPEVAAVGSPVSCSASAASTIGSSLDFTWSVVGPGTANVNEDGRNCTFSVSAEGTYTVTVSVEDDFGTIKSLSKNIEATPVNIEVPTYTIISEQVLDGKLNPGELLTIELDIRNSSDQNVTGDMVVTGLDGITVGSGVQSGITLSAGSTVSRQITVQLPANFSEATALLPFEFTANSVLVASFAIEFVVDFYVELNTIYSPVVDRVLHLSGKVANPSIGTAHLVIDDDFEQLYEVPVSSDGTFGQDIIVEASAEEEEHVAGIMADSGSWHEEEFAAFTSQVPPTGFRVTLSWDTGGTDVDLWVTDPFGNRCYFGNRYVAASGLTLDTDDTNGYGPENISSLAPPSGAYFVQVHYWSDHDSENAIGSSCTIVIRENEGTEEETVRYYYGYLGDSGEIWDVTTIEIGGRSSDSGEPIDNYHWIDPATLPAK
ncbi:PKD domain-containing protein [bacterium]|nr:PKD domain-containing protein [bacterium]